MLSLSEHLDQYPDWLNPCGVSATVLSNHPASGGVMRYISGDDSRYDAIIGAGQLRYHARVLGYLPDGKIRGWLRLASYDGSAAHGSCWAWGQWVVGVAPIQWDNDDLLWSWLADPYNYPGTHYPDDLPVDDIMDGDAVVAGRVVVAWDGSVIWVKYASWLTAGEHAGCWALDDETVTIAGGNTALLSECVCYSPGRYALVSSLVEALDRRGEEIQWPEYATCMCDDCDTVWVDSCMRVYSNRTVCPECAENYCGACENHVENCDCRSQRGEAGVLDYSSDVHAVLGVVVPKPGRFDLVVGLELEFVAPSRADGDSYADEVRDAGVAIGCHDGSLPHNGVEIKTRAVKYTQFPGLLDRLPDAPKYSRAWKQECCGIHVNIGVDRHDTAWSRAQALLQGVTSSDHYTKLLRGFGRRDAQRYAPCGSGVAWDGKYCAIATHKSYRAEFRLFQSTLKRESIQIYVDFAHAVTLWALCEAARLEHFSTHDVRAHAQAGHALLGLELWLLEYGSPAVQAFGRVNNLFSDRALYEHNTRGLKAVA